MDIETAPNLAHCWSLWDNNVSLNQLITPSYVLCWSAKWVGEDKIFFASRQNKTARQMLAGVHNLLSTADAVITWNGISFDLPILSKEFLEYGFEPPAPYAQIDLMMIAKKKFRFTSNKLEHVVKVLKIGSKLKHEGHELWIGCMTGKKKAWKTMKRYNVNDTRILEGVYQKFLPWITNHPNVGLREGRPEACSNCGHDELTARGFAYTKLGKYQRYKCKKCCAWTRDGKRVSLATQRGLAS